MPYLPTLADRAWYAYHCLPREEDGEPPSMRVLEKASKISGATLSKTFRGERSNHQHQTIKKVAAALHVSEHWLTSGGADAPRLTGPCPPRIWKRYRELPDWGPMAKAALARPGDPTVPPEAYLAGADMYVFREAPKLTPDLVAAIAMYAWETCSAEEQAEYSTTAAASSSPGKSQRSIRSAKRLESGPPGRGKA